MCSLFFSINFSSNFYFQVSNKIHSYHQFLTSVVFYFKMIFIFYQSLTKKTMRFTFINLKINEIKQLIQDIVRFLENSCNMREFKMWYFYFKKLFLIHCTWSFIKQWKWFKSCVFAKLIKPDKCIPTLQSHDKLGG